jgi:hypothetical protein
MSDYRYEIDENNEVRIWDLVNTNEENAPFIYQPHWPNGTAWADAAEATAWAIAFIESLENPTAGLAAGNSPEEPVITTTSTSVDEQLGE